MLIRRRAQLRVATLVWYRCGQCRMEGRMGLGCRGEYCTDTSDEYEHFSTVTPVTHIRTSLLPSRVPVINHSRDRDNPRTLTFRGAPSILAPDSFAGDIQGICGFHIAPRAPPIRDCIPMLTMFVRSPPSPTSPRSSSSSRASLRWNQLNAAEIPPPHRPHRDPSSTRVIPRCDTLICTGEDRSRRHYPRTSLPSLSRASNKPAFSELRV
jgi:hypothetical protein